jgi:drug/metabolite transporter (DMT)-like permease
MGGMPLQPLSPGVLASLATTYVVWGTTYLAIRFALESFAPFYQMGTRFIVAGALLFAWLRLRGRSWPSARQWLHAAILGTVMLGGGISLVAVAEQTISSGAVTVLIPFVPLWMVVLSRFFGQPARGVEWLAVAVGTAGVAVLVIGQEFRASPGGTLAVVSGTFFWAFGSLLSRRLDVPQGAVGFAAEMLAGGVVLLAISALIGESWTLQATPRAWLAWSYLVTFGSIVAFSAYMYLVQTVSPALAASYAYANPVIALAAGAWLADERVAPQTLLALPLILAAVAMLAWTNRGRTTLTPAADTAEAEARQQAQSMPPDPQRALPQPGLEPSPAQPRSS